MSLGRRDFMIGTVGVAAGTSLLEACDDGDGAKPDASTPDAGNASPLALPIDTSIFAHGVASGDPLSDRVILWTRISGATQPLSVDWIIASDPQLTQNVQATQVVAYVDTDYTVKVDVTGLQPGTTYYYAFFLPGRGRSVVGRTRTLPAQIEHARLVFTSCANLQNGYFNAYRAIAKRADLDVWVHLGDYIYEYGPGEYGDPALLAQRPLSPAKETVTLEDYRARYANYRADPDLQEVHRQHPLVAVWDDHEFANNAYKDDAQNHTSPEEDPLVNEGLWSDRKRAASKAFLEWLPIRVPDAEPVPKIFRSFAFGDLFDLIMLDTRIIARDKQAGDDSGLPGSDTGDPAVWVDPTRQIIGTEQEAWFLQTLNQSRMRSATWRLVGNQVIFAQTRYPGTPNILYSDFWDGYQPARKRVIDYIVSQGIQNVVFMTGDIHSSWAMEISEDPFASEPKPPFAVELVGPSVTSQAFEQDSALAATLVSALLGGNQHVKFGEATKKGYVLIDVTRSRIQAEWYFVNEFKLPNDASETLYTAFTCDNGAARLVVTTSQSAAKPDAPASA